MTRHLTVNNKALYVEYELILYVLVGKVRQKWYTQTVSAVGRGSVEAVKSYLDPQNIFAAGNLFQEAKL